MIDRQARDATSQKEILRQEARSEAFAGELLHPWIERQGIEIERGCNRRSFQHLDEVPGETKARHIGHGSGTVGRENVGSGPIG